MTGDGQVTLDDKGLFQLQVNGRAVLWVTGGAKELQVRLMACALKALREEVQSVVEVYSPFHEEVLDEVQVNRGKQRAAASRW